MKRLSPQYLSDFCLELRLILRAGLSVGEGLDLLGPDKTDRAAQTVLHYFKRADLEDLSLSDKLGKCGLFPRYLTETVRLGEASGRLDDTLVSLSDYYRRRAELTARVWRAILHPFLLLLASAAVVIVLVTQVLPVFDEISALMGTQLTGFAVWLLSAGRWLVSAQAVILAGLGGFTVVGLLVYLIPPARRTATRGFVSRRGNGVLSLVSAAHFVSALSLAVSAGHDPEQALSLAEEACSGSYGLCEKMSACRYYLSLGENLESCLLKSRVYPAQASRLLALGAKSGSSAEVMATLARRSEEKAATVLEARVDRLEPLMLIAVSLIVGLTLFSVMLPLLAVLSSLT